MSHVLEPLSPPYPPAIADILSRYPKGEDDYLLSLFRVFANSERFLKDKGVANLLDAQSPLTIRQREIIILRVTANTKCEYEWGVHVSIFSRAAGLSEDEVRSTLAADPGDSWNAEERLLIRVVDDLCEYACIQPAQLGQFQASFSKEAQLDIMSLVGHYHLISYVANSTGLPPEPMAARFS